MSLLSRVTTGRQARPLRLLVYGVPGIGKTTLAAAAPAPIFLPVEEGCGHVEVARLPQPQTWQDLLASVRAAAEEPHDYRTLVVDSLSAAEPLCWRAVCEAGKKPDIEAFGYGKGYVAALDRWRELLAALENLQRRRQMGVVLLAHSALRTFKNPEGDDYDMWQLALNEKASGLLRGWCEDVLFAKWEVFAAQAEGSKAKGVSTGKRLLHTQESGPWQAKNRHDLPPTLPLDWAALAGAMGLSNDAAQERRINSSKRS